MTISTDAQAAAGALRSGLPDFFIVGSAKSGTTALYEMLRAHPQIYMPESKEPWFFASELHVRTPPRPEGTPRSLEEYASWFRAAKPDQRVGEASALYLWSRTAAKAIAAVQPQARIIAICREPASLLRSLHMQFLQTHVETETDLRRALALEPRRREGSCIPRHSYWPDALRYSDHVRYVEQLQRYHDVFPAEQMLVLIYDDFHTDNRATVRRVLRFLEVDDAVDVTEVHANPTVSVRSRRIHQFVHALSVGHGRAPRALKQGIKLFTPGALRRKAVSVTRRRFVFGAPHPVDAALMTELRTLYKPEVVALSDYLGRDLVSLWGYDTVP